MKKFFLLLLMTISTCFSSSTEIKNDFNKKLINKFVNQYKYKIPIYQNELISLIGIYSPNNKTIVLEYLIDYEVIKNNIRIYNNSSKNKISNIQQYLLGRKIINKFKKEKLHSHLNKCNLTYRKKSIFSQGLTIIFRYYMNDKFYTEIKLNKNICDNYEQ